MKTNPWMVVSLVLALTCGYLVGARTENEAEAEAPEYQYFINPAAHSPLEMLETPKYSINLGRFIRVNLKTGVYEELKAAGNLDSNKERTGHIHYGWYEQWDTRDNSYHDRAKSTFWRKP